jgi:hypothetical protein
MRSQWPLQLTGGNANHKLPSLRDTASPRRSTGALGAKCPAIVFNARHSWQKRFAAKHITTLPETKVASHKRSIGG